MKSLRPITVDTGKIRAVGTAVSGGHRTAPAQAELRNGADRLPATATSGCTPFPASASRGRDSIAGFPPASTCTQILYLEFKYS